MSDQTKRTTGYAITLALAIAIVAFTLFGYKKFHTPPALLIPIIGLTVFFGMLIIVNIFSEDTNLMKAEVRKAIAASLLAVYFFIISASLFSDASPLYRLPQADPVQQQDPISETQYSEKTMNSELPEETETNTVTEVGSTTVIDILDNLLSDFTKLIMVVVGFYFAGRSTEEVVKTIRKTR